VGRFSNDDFIFSDAWIAAAIRSELSLSIPGFERDLHHVDGSDCTERKAECPTGDRRVADQHRHCARFNELALRIAKNSKQILSKWVWCGCNAPNPVCFCFTLSVVCHFKPICLLFKPGGFRMAAKAEEQIAISVVELDSGASLEAVRAREMHVGGDYPRSSKGAVFVIDVRYIVEGVILSAWLALPNASLGGVERARTGRVGVGGQGAVAVERY